MEIMKSLTWKNDTHQMNWIEGDTEWGTVKAPDGLAVEYTSENTGEEITEHYKFTNTTNKDFFTELADISIYTPFNDDYKDSATCMTSRCHTHIWCGENITYIMALRMGGEPPHAGLILTEGSIGGYSVARDLSKMSNDRGDFILHPSPVSLAPNESFTVSLTLFSHGGKEDFYNKLKCHPGYIHVEAEQYIVFEGEKIHIEMEPASGTDERNIAITRDGAPVNYSIQERKIIIDEMPEHTGEYRYEIQIGNTKTHCCILVQPEFTELLKARCQFIAEKQQYHKAGSHLDGAYLIYDNEEKHIYYRIENDFNGGRERICMGILLARYLQTHDDGQMENSLRQYAEYVERELFDPQTGRVYDDYMRDTTYRRPYNYPWVSLFYLELYTLYGKKEYLTYAYKVMKAFYTQENGTHFYAIEIPLERILSELDRAGMKHEYDELMGYFTAHCGFILERGTNYPAHEVNFEQSIVAPATNLLLQMYQATGDKKYLDGAESQMKVLELFNGLQPDYHMYEVAIRHWDGYWFGKKRLYGDTYPHYWSALTANAYRDYAEITGNKEYLKKAESAFRGVMSMFFADGSASCAYVYPQTVNGTRGAFFDAYANDQDWGIYFMLRYREKNNIRK